MVRTTHTNGTYHSPLVYGTYYLPPLPSYISGLERCVWPGRCQIIDRATSEGVTYFLDGAHTVESMQVIRRCAIIEN